MKTIDEQFEQYRRMTIHPMASEAQVLDVKMAFVAGFMCGFVQITGEIGEMEEDDAVAALLKLGTHIDITAKKSVAEIMRKMGTAPNTAQA